MGLSHGDLDLGRLLIAEQPFAARLDRGYFHDGAMAVAERCGEISEFNRPEQIGRCVDEVAHHPCGCRSRSAPFLPCQRNESRRAAFGGLERAIAIGTETKAQGGKGGVVVART